MAKPKKPQRAEKLPTMKKWGVLSWASAFVLTLILIIGVFATDKELSVYSTIVGLSWGEVATFNVVYAWKEKAQNKLKITYNCLENLAEKYGIENITPILENILRD